MTFSTHKLGLANDAGVRWCCTHDDCGIFLTPTGLGYITRGHVKPTEEHEEI